MITNRLYVTESANLIRLLIAAGVPHEVRSLCDGVQIIYPSRRDYCGDAICHPYSYGHERGLLETMGIGACYEDDDVEGHLTAETVFDRWYAHYQAQKKG